MNAIKLPLVALFLGASLDIANAAAEFAGVLVSQGTTYVAVRLEEGAPARWVQIGDSIGEYRAVTYSSHNESLTLRNNSGELVLTLRTAAVQSAPTLALLESLVRNGDLGLERELKDLKTLEERRSKTAAELAKWESRVLEDASAVHQVTNLRRQLAIDQSKTEYFLQKLIAEARNRARK